MMINGLQPLCMKPDFLVPSIFLGSPQALRGSPFDKNSNFRFSRSGISVRRRGAIVRGFLPVDPWAPTIDSQSIASQLFAVSLFPYIGFLYFITKSKSAPKLTLFGFYFLLAFVGATTG